MKSKGIFPYGNTEYSRSMSPPKLFQYLASGRLIISSEMASLGRVELARRETCDSRVSGMFDAVMSHMPDRK